MAHNRSSIYIALSLAALVTQAPATREDRWHEDLAVLARDLPKLHVDFAKLYPPDRFKAEVAAIERAVPQSSDADLTLRLMRLIASAHVGHTTIRLGPGAPQLHHLPITFAWYSDGLGVMSASEPYRAALGLRVTRIGTLTPEAFEAAVAPYISYELDDWLHQLSPASMTTVEIVQTIGQLEGDHLNVTLARPDGTTFTIPVKVPDAQSPAPALIRAQDALDMPVPLFRKHPAKNYWYEYLADQKALFVQYNRCQADPQQSMAAFAADLFAFADSHPVDRTIVDLRLNTGGDSDVIKPLIAGLKVRPALKAQGHLFALIGPRTFSSGLLAAYNFRYDLHAVLIGEPSGERPNSYGDIRYLTLPNSKIEIQYSTKFFRIVPGDPKNFPPDVQVGRTLADTLSGRDPVLDAALKYSPR